MKPARSNHGACSEPSSPLNRPFEVPELSFLSNSKHKALLVNQFISVKLCGSARVFEKKFPIYFVLSSLIRTSDFVALDACGAYSSVASLKKVLSLDNINKKQKILSFILYCSRLFVPLRRKLLGGLRYVRYKFTQRANHPRVFKEDPGGIMACNNRKPERRRKGSHSQRP